MTGGWKLSGYRKYHNVTHITSGGSFYAKNGLLRKEITDCQVKEVTN